MADYKNIKGFNIQYLDSDPPNPIEGQMWFNSTTQTLKGAEVGGELLIWLIHLITEGLLEILLLVLLRVVFPQLRQLKNGYAPELVH
jgi:hypothetical protein